MAAAYVSEQTDLDNEDDRSGACALSSGMTDSTRATRATKMKRSWSTTGSAEGSFQNGDIMKRFIADSSGHSAVNKEHNTMMESINEGNIMKKKNDEDEVGNGNDVESGEVASSLESIAGASK